VADPVSWLMIERGWKVADADGDEVGKVEETVGDSSADIFNGLTVSVGLFARGRYVPAEQVASINEGLVHLKLSKAEVEQLPEYSEPPGSHRVEP
jgi:uncharacterized protein YrrD